MATYDKIVPLRQTGPELNYGKDPNVRNIFGWRRGYNDPWRDEKNQRLLARGIFGILGGPFASSLLSGGFKAQDYLDPYGWNRPFHKSEETMEKEKAADIESRDDSPIIAQERRKLWKLYQRLGRPADLASLKRHIRVFG